MGNYMPTSLEEESPSTPSSPVDVVNYRGFYRNLNNSEALNAARLVRQKSNQSVNSVDKAENSDESLFTTPEEKGHRKEIREIDYKQYEYDFENIVFEGGGAKGIVYVGALEVGLNSSLFYLPFRVLFMIKIYM